MQEDPSDPDVFYSHTPEPANFAKTQDDVKAFVKYHAEKGTRVAFVTSGGTTVPLERNTVRFIDNFSGGNRGAASAEHFLAQGYAVIFLGRKNSLFPFSRFFALRHPTSEFIDFLTVNAEHRVAVVPEHAEIEQEVVALLQAYHKARDENRLLKVQYVSVHDYLFLLRFISTELNHTGAKGLIYAAAAVSDFYIPWGEMAQHKIQSGADPTGLQLHLRNVPKVLGKITSDWASKVFVISFKLETDEHILEHKVKQSLSNYRQQLVVANMLQSYKTKVMLYAKDGSVQTVLKEGPSDIEEKLILAICEKHGKFLEEQESK